ncbi:integrase arm-type DNA-binding domain-containing protein [Methylobacillus gramineus]|uniref:tyrosine-type recombinase/integrase n=1 Tax=Methylobacillus gramineus TaxID=755169 RepID=UPI001CFF5F1D|nr:integrase arm-type DNA-binding domain-containing protein [Methylobacillus gramineus]MCB5184015.1 integrase arm-type DNA-binding domain-containing protein [Methylobacillus gramineus]
MALTDVSIRNAKPRDNAYKLYDEGGLFIQVTPSGGKWWRFKYRFDAKEKLLSLGTYPEVSLSDARGRRDDARKLLAQDPAIDPSANRKAQKSSRSESSANSFEVITREWLGTHMSDKSTSHQDRTLRRLEVHLFPWIGKQPISDITAPAILECLKRVQNQNKLETAHRTLQAAGQVFRFAVQTGRAVRDVTADLRGALPSPQIKHMASITDPKEVSELLRAVDGFTGTLTVQTALRLAPLLFVRPGELRTARWADIDLEAGEWRYRVSKTKTDHLVPLSHQAIALLKDIQPLSGHGEFVFMGGHDPKKPMSEAAINAALKRMGYDTQTQITGHGFRAMARTLLHERLNIDPHIIEHQLAHKVPDALGNAYNRTRFIEQRKQMMQEWADYLDELKAGAKVIPLKTA